MQVIEPNGLYRAEEVAQMLQIGGSTVRAWIRKGRLKAYKPGKEYLIRGKDLPENLPAAEPEPKTKGRTSAV